MLLDIDYVWFHKLYVDYVFFYKLNADCVFYLALMGELTSSRPLLLGDTVAMCVFCLSLLSYHCSDALVAMCVFCPSLLSYHRSDALVATD
jgi:hypothetical protein